MFSLKATVKVLKDDTRALADNLAQLTGTQVLVGIPAENASRKAVPGQDISNAALGYIHDKGSPAANIPARPWLEPGITENEEPITDALKAVGVAVLEERSNDVVQRRLTAVGLIAAAGVKKKIQSGPFIPLKPATLAARRRRGRTGTKILIDTGQMRNAVNFVLRKK